MDKRIESRIARAKRALEFSRAHASPSPGYAAALKQLEDEITRATQLAAEQGRGLAEVRTATIEKERIKRSLRRSHLRHLAGVAERAAVEDPELAQKFELPRLPSRGLAFRAAARAMIDLAEEQKELLARYGLVDELLQNAHQSVDKLDLFADRSAEGRRIHVGASASLEVSVNELARAIRILDGYNRFRFASDPNLMAGWTSAINIVGPAERTSGEPDAGQPASPNPPAGGSQANPAA